MKSRYSKWINLRDVPSTYPHYRQSENSKGDASSIRKELAGVVLVAVVAVQAARKGHMVIVTLHLLLVTVYLPFYAGY
jgi:hypothetical protein